MYPNVFFRSCRFFSGYFIWREGHFIMSNDATKASPQASLQLALGTVSFALCFAA